MKTEPTKICSICKKPKKYSEMDICVKNGKTYYRSRCKSCCNENTRKWREKNPEEVRRRDRVVTARRSRQRASLVEQERWICIDAKSSDNKAGFENDLTRDFVKELIAKGCIYCGETKMRMTLDRIDNDKGHLRSNVVPACIRCNYVRRNMPYEAWIKIAPAIREVRVLGLFGTWTSRVK